MKYLLYVNLTNMKLVHGSSLFSFFMNILGPIAMWAAQGKIKKKYNIEDERKAMFTAVYQWADAVEGSVGGPFQGGAVPSVADLCVFGCKGVFFDYHTNI